MKIVVEPARMQQMLKQTMFYKSKPLLVSVTAIINPEKGITLLDLSLGVAGFYARYPKEYFLQLECEQPEIVVLSKRILDILSNAFKEDKQLTISTLENKIYVRGVRETFADDLEQGQKPSLPFKLVTSPSGVVPEKFEPLLRVPINADELNFPDAENYTLLATDEGKMFVEITNIGKYTKELKLNDNPNIPKIIKATSLTLDADYFQRLITNLSGEVVLSLDKMSTIVHQKTKDYHITYYLTGKQEVEEQSLPTKPEEQPKQEPSEEEIEP